MHLVKQSFLVAALVGLFAAGCKHTGDACCADVPESGATVKAAKTTGTTPTQTSDTQTLFDGKTLTGWMPTDFAGKGDVSVSKGELILGNGYMTGVTWTGAVPRMNYEISLDAKRTEGSDFFCGLTFPVKEDYCSLIVGGWGGSTIGISSIDGQDASENETSSSMNFVNDKWYHIRVRVTPGKIGAWIDDEHVLKLDTTDKRLSTRLEVDASKPLGIATWNTAAALKNIQLKKVE
jgi:hypothetical protein